VITEQLTINISNM